jgi:hypothetical protein
MAMEEPTTLRVVSAGNIVEAEWMPSGVPGLALVGRPVSAGWRLVHIPTGRAVSRSAEHFDPEAVRALARMIGTLADWTDPNVAVSRPDLREELDRLLAAWRGDSETTPKHALRAPVDETRQLDAYAIDTASLDTRSLATRRMDEVSVDARRLDSLDSLGTASAVGAGMAPATEAERHVERHDAGRGLAEELQSLVERARSAEHETVVLREVVRRLRDLVSSSTFDQVMGTISASDRGLLGSLLPDGHAADATGVVQALRPEMNTLKTPQAPSGRQPTRVPPPTRPRRVPPDIAAS